MQPSRLAILAAAWAGVLSETSAAHGQDPPDPTFWLPKTRIELVRDPHFTGSSIGEMYRPEGRVRRVTWYEAGGFKGAHDPSGWEKRAVLEYDDSGRCVRVEDWAMGEREFRSGIQAGPDGSERVLDWNECGEVSCSTIEVVADGEGRPVATLLVPWNVNGLGPTGDEPTILQEYGYDAIGRVHRRLTFRSAPPGATPSSVEFQYDSAGRISAVDGRRFEYDAHGRIGSSTFEVRGSPSWRSEYEYEPSGRVSRSSTTEAGLLVSSTTCLYGEDGRLVHRSSCERQRPLSMPDQRSILVEESFDGIDRPLSRAGWDERGRQFSNARWTYAFDPRGNWTQRSIQTRDGEPVPEILREIEYTD